MSLMTPEEIRAIRHRDPATRAERILHHAGRLGAAARDVLKDRDEAVIELLARGRKQSAVASMADVPRAQMLRYRARANLRAAELGLDQPFPDVPVE